MLFLDDFISTRSILPQDTLTEPDGVALHHVLLVLAQLPLIVPVGQPFSRVHEC